MQRDRVYTNYFLIKTRGHLYLSPRRAGPPAHFSVILLALAAGSTCRPPGRAASASVPAADTRIARHLFAAADELVPAPVRPFEASRLYQCHWLDDALVSVCCAMLPQLCDVMFIAGGERLPALRHLCAAYTGSMLS